MLLDEFKRKLRKKRNAKKAQLLQRFFKTGPGEYGEGDIFLGITVPTIRKLVGEYYDNLSLKQVLRLLKSHFHEERLAALLIFVAKFNKSDYYTKKNIFDIYTKNTKFINNWDLVDLSAPNIVGQYLIDKDKHILYKFAKSNILWERRIAVLSTFWCIKHHEFGDSLQLSEILIGDKEDLIHKAVGWMLREIGKRALKTEEKFLNKFSKVMPRTMLRYAIEKFPQAKRRLYLGRP